MRKEILGEKWRPHKMGKLGVTTKGFFLSGKKDENKENFMG